MLPKFARGLTVGASVDAWDPVFPPQAQHKTSEAAIDTTNIFEIKARVFCFIVIPRKSIGNLFIFIIIYIALIIGNTY